MKIHHTKSLGDLGVLKVQCNLFEQGYIPCIPLTEHVPYDLVACNENGCKRIQVKIGRRAQGVCLLLEQFR
ncbi:group I intron-associated PD-(D/E)XK endonuclease [Tunicatimonas pelagia]|uniref:group I intron-associated PD-(D/E)XK endonuclease n=1 Tax=Tunicatimonas pelagia TaxID=931531 RepID=UPI00345C8F87